MPAQESTKSVNNSRNQAVSSSTHPRPIQYLQRRRGLRRRPGHQIRLLQPRQTRALFQLPLGAAERGAELPDTLGRALSAVGGSSNVCVMSDSDQVR